MADGRRGERKILTFPVEFLLFVVIFIKMNREIVVLIHRVVHG